MPKTSEKRKATEDGGPKRKRPQLVLAPRHGETVPSDTSTLPADSFHAEERNADDEELNQTGPGDETIQEMIDEGILESEDSDESISDGEAALGHQITDPMRNDMAIVRTRWQDEEVDALMTALNVNRDAVKFHFDGPGGGKDVKRQGWRDVASYVNDVCNPHRTVKQCRDKADDYTQRVKGKYNKLRFAVSQTGRGKIKKSLKLKSSEDKALDYLREEAVKGIHGIDAMDVGYVAKKTSKKNRKLLWDPKRETKPEYETVEMTRQGVPKNYKQKNNTRLAREQKAKRKQENTKLMKAERKKEVLEAKKITVNKAKEKQMAADDQRAMQTVHKSMKKKKGDKKKKKASTKRNERERKKQKKQDKMLRKQEKAARKQARKMKREERLQKKEAKNKGHAN